MEEHHAVDDQSHYEISLTATQAFVAFVLLLLSLAASFAFGLMLGKGQMDERLVVQRETPVVSEATLAPRKNDGRIVELGVSDDDFQPVESPMAAPPVVITEETAPAAGEPAESTPLHEAISVESRKATDAQVPASQPPAGAATPAGVAHYAQLLSTSDQKTAENLAAKLIDAGFMTSYVERSQAEKGPVFRVRVRFLSEQEARSAEARLRQFSSEVWITKR
ncbi:MAG TPA: SPOR domain-containing protein [Thermoanaerobaculia bacterium]